MNFNEHGPPEVDFKLILGGKELLVSPWDGYVEGIEEPCTVELHFCGNEKNFPLAVNRNRRDRPVTPLKSFGSIKVNVARAKTGEQHLKTFPNNNNVRILSLDYYVAPVLFTVALASQNGVFFFTCDKTYEFTLAPKEMAAKWLYPKKWDSLVEYLELITGQEIALFPNKGISLEVGENAGLVNWWDSSLGLGSVWVRHHRKTMEVAAHWSEISREDSKLAFLKPGEPVIYKEVIPKRKTTKYDSEFKYELTGLSLAA